MLIVIIALGSTDLLFALDSIPAIYGLTQEPYLVFTANVFALMGLRQLYFLLGGLLRKLVYLSIGLSVILAFIGIKLVFHALHEYHLDERLGIPFSLEIPIWLSLTFIIVTLTITTVASLVKSRYDADNAPPPAEAETDEPSPSREPDPETLRSESAPPHAETADRLQDPSPDPAVCRQFRGGGGQAAAVTADGRSRLDRRGDQLGHIGAEHDLDGLQHVGRHLVQVGLVALGQEHRGQPGPLRGQQLLLGPADRQHPAVQGDLAGHPDVGADRPAQRHRRQRRHHGDAGRRAVLGHRARRGRGCGCAGRRSRGR